MNVHEQQFQRDAAQVSSDLRHRGRIQIALKKYEAARGERKSLFQDWQAARERAGEIKWDAVNHLDRYLIEFTQKFEARGGRVHWASTAQQAREIILHIVREKRAKSIIKSKVMTGEEIHLNEALEAAGYEVVESDLGEYIVQLRREAPYHFVFPAMHLTRCEISELFERELHTNPTNDPEELTMIARRVLRDKYITADVGISGANFAIAETGMISITENEGNARLTCALPKVHIALLGIEKILPRLEDLALFLPMLATSGTGQLLTGYNSLYGGPRQSDECDGPAEMHVVLLDNGRTRLLADAEQRDALHCIRCGACLNVCPVYKNIGGHSYGTTYQGPIGAVITPHLRGLAEWKYLSDASSLCGACTEICPVKIDLHHRLLHNRRNAAQQVGSWRERIVFRLYAFVANRPTLFAVMTRVFRELARVRLIAPLRAWTRTRDLPPIPEQSFRDHWKARR
ncbi:MAG: iron-sulfur cluster-binding protein [Anaerolineae bacterium]|nr:iron-sulfur cluster-binding protein [Phycisphaerae bacterium]